MDEKYTIEYSLKRLYDKAENDKLNGAKFKPKDRPNVIIQNKKTSIINFGNLCNSFKRKKNDVKLFIDNEMQTSSSLRGENDNILMINNIYNQKQIETVLNKYITKYVVCPAIKCSSGDTVIEKKNRLSVLKCNVCNAEKSIN